MILKPSKINTYPQMFINCFPLKCFPVAAYSLFLQTLNSIEKDSVLAVANFIEKNPELKAKVQLTNPDIFKKATVIEQDGMQIK